MNPLVGAALAAVAYESCVQWLERAERADVYAIAESDAIRRGLPLIVVGCPKWGLWHGHGSATLDIGHDQFWCRCPNPITADLREVDREFKPKSVIIYSSHVLEHLVKEDAERAVAAMNKVSVAQYHVFPNKFSLSGWLAPDHKCWPVVTEGNSLAFQEKRWP